MLARMEGPRAATQAFTLIELLIVVAIILILIAIALPNFLEAQIRAKATKTQAELRTLLTALETYFLDFHLYPCQSEQDFKKRGHFDAGLTWLTSPIPYIFSLPADPFGIPTGDNNAYESYEGGGLYSNQTNTGRGTVLYVVWGRGPTGNSEQPFQNENPHCEIRGDGKIRTYSATNGTRSNGSLHMFTGDGRWFGVRTHTANPAALTDPGKQEPYIVDSINYHGRLPPSSF